MALDLGSAGLDRTSLREQCRELLRSHIVEGALAPGERLVETRLSDQLGVSRGTLREALRHLEQEGLVVSDGRGHMRVRTPTARDIVEIYDVRIALETMAAVLMAQSPDRDERIVRLRDALEPLKAGGAALAATVERDLAFHRRLCELGGNQTLLDTWTHLLSRIRASIVAAGPSLTPGLATYERHAVIVDAIAAGDEAALRDALRSHMREAATRIAEATGEAASASPGPR
jgi:DNA-binding GntR family transcriptional regulator